MDKLDRHALRILPLERRVVDAYYNDEYLRPEQFRSLCASHERLRKELSGAQIVAKERLLEGQWTRSIFTSIWAGPNIELIVIQNGGSSEEWKWTARGWREPDDCDEVDREGWVRAISREDAELAALKFYMHRDE